MTSREDQLSTVTDIMRATRIAVLTYVSEDGDLVSMPMATQDLDEPGTARFLTQKDSAKITAITADPRVNVAYASDAGWVSLSGTARVNEDRAELKDLWDASAGAFMTGGPEDDNNIILEVTGRTAEYWDTPGKVATVVAMVKGLITDDQPDLGDNDTVAL